MASSDLQKCMAHKVFLFQSGSRLEQRSLRGMAIVCSSGHERGKTRGLYEGFLVSSSSSSSSIGFFRWFIEVGGWVGSMGFVVEILDSCEKRALKRDVCLAENR